MPKKEFRIVASTGDNFYQFYYIIQMPAGDFYHGMVGSDPSRTSIHTSGQINWHYSKGKQISFPAKQKLTELRGIRQLCSMSIGKLVFQNPHFSIAPSKTKVKEPIPVFSCHRILHEPGQSRIHLNPKIEEIQTNPRFF